MPHPTPCATFRRRLAADPVAIRHTLVDLSATLRTSDLDPDLISSLELVLAEVLNNIAKHAYGGADGPIRIEVSGDGAALSVATLDMGKPLPGLRLPEGAPAKLDVDTDALPEGGFGWFLIHTMTADIDYTRRLGANDLRFRICAENA